MPIASSPTNYNIRVWPAGIEFIGPIFDAHCEKTWLNMAQLRAKLRELAVEEVDAVDLGVFDDPASWFWAADQSDGPDRWKKHTTGWKTKTVTPWIHVCAAKMCKGAGRNAMRDWETCRHIIPLSVSMCSDCRTAQTLPEVATPTKEGLAPELKATPGRKPCTPAKTKQDSDSTGNSGKVLKLHDESLMNDISDDVAGSLERRGHFATLSIDALDTTQLSLRLGAVAQAVLGCSPASSGEQWSKIRALGLVKGSDELGGKNLDTISIEILQHGCALLGEQSWNPRAVLDHELLRRLREMDDDSQVPPHIAIVLGRPEQATVAQQLLSLPLGWSRDRNWTREFKEAQPGQESVPAREAVEYTKTATFAEGLAPISSRALDRVADRMSASIVVRLHRPIT